MLSSLPQTEKAGTQKTGGNLCYSFWPSGRLAWQMLKNEALGRKICLQFKHLHTDTHLSNYILPSTKAA